MSFSLESLTAGGKSGQESNSENGRTCRLLYLIGELHTGGSERQLYYLLRTMDRERYKPAVVVWNYSENDIHLPLIRSLDVPIYGVTPTGSRVTKLTVLRRLVRQLEPEVVHSWSFYTNFAAYFATAATRSLPIGSIRSDFSWAITECGSVLGSLSGRWPQTQICNSLSAAENVRSSRGLFVPSQISVVRNCIDLEQFRYAPDFNDEPSRILGIGYLLPVKRWERLLRAAHRLRQRGINFTIKIAGDGPLRSDLEREALSLGVGDRVLFLGHITNISSLLAESSFVVHTADAEGCPNSVMEAMACGRAVVAADAGDIRYLIDDGKSGFVVPSDDGEALVDRIGKLIENSELRNGMGRAARAKAEQQFRLGNLVNETLAAYSSCGWKDTSVQ